MLLQNKLHKLPQSCKYLAIQLRYGMFSEMDQTVVCYHELCIKSNLSKKEMQPRYHI